jgi:hypothetical protein
MTRRSPWGPLLVAAVLAAQAMAWIAGWEWPS